MAFVFGNTMICEDNESANAVAFNRDIGLYSVSKDGTTYDPSGTLSGGAALSSGGILVKVQDLKKMERRLKSVQSELAEIDNESRSGGRQKREAWKNLSRQLEIKTHEVRLLEQQIGGGDAAIVHYLITWSATRS